MKHLPMPDLNYLKSILDYNPDTGVFVWKVTKNRRYKSGSIAGVKRQDGYYKIGINNKIYFAQRIAYYYVTGIDAGNLEVDHINGNTSDNRFVNLRFGNHQNNIRNQKKRTDNTSGIKGVRWHKRDKVYEAYITINYKLIYLGRYNSKFYAALVYARAAKKYFGEWRRVI